MRSALLFSSPSVDLSNDLFYPQPSVGNFVKLLFLIGMSGNGPWHLVEVPQDPIDMVPRDRDYLRPRG